MEENKIIIEFTKTEYNYVYELCHMMYKNLKKFPKSMRTPKFYVLESIIKNHFNK